VNSVAYFGGNGENLYALDAMTGSGAGPSTPATRTGPHGPWPNGQGHSYLTGNQRPFVLPPKPPVVIADLLGIHPKTAER
jgi:hypothetical protein